MTSPLPHSIGLVYLEHLTAQDTALLADVAGTAGGSTLLDRPEGVAELLSSSRTYDAVFQPRPGQPSDVLLHVSPFLTFAVAVHRAAAELDDVSFTEEWVGLRQRVPVFDTDVLRDFLADPLRRLFLVELLASYTHVTSGSTWVHTRRGWRRRRFSELDPVRLASLLEVVGDDERPGIYRRLGDLALFLTGVFPDHTAAHGLPPIDVARLLRSGQLPLATDTSGDLPGAIARLGTVGVLEHLGGRWYDLASSSVEGPLTATMGAAAEVAGRFRHARRILNFVTDRFLFPFGSQWFGVAGG